jgi:hypothetical protein
LDQQGFILCHPAARPNLELSTFISTVGQTEGGRLANEDITPATAVIADVIRANDPMDPQARKEALLAAAEPSPVPLFESVSHGQVGHVG